MNYHKLYERLIFKRVFTPAIGYTERHHILPKALGGKDTENNLVVLTGREHWIAHLLLFKIHGCSKTAAACHMMGMRCEERGIPRIRNSRMYQSVRESLVPMWKANGKKRTGKANGSYGSHWICNVDRQLNKRVDKTLELPEGWIAGRSKWLPPPKSRKKKRLPNGLTSAQEARRKKSTKKYEIDGEIFDGLKPICKRYNLSHPGVIGRLRSESFPTWNVHSPPLVSLLPR